MVTVSNTAQKILAAAGVTPEDAEAALGLKDGDRLTVAMARRYVESLKAKAAEPVGEPEDGPSPEGEPQEAAEATANEPIEEPEGLYFQADPPAEVRHAIVRAIVERGLTPRVLAWDRRRDSVAFITPDGREVIVPLEA